MCMCWGRECMISIDGMLSWWVSVLIFWCRDLNCLEDFVMFGFVYVWWMNGDCSGERGFGLNIFCCVFFCLSV